MPGDVLSGTGRNSGSVRIYFADGGTIIHHDAGLLVIDEGQERSCRRAGSTRSRTFSKTATRPRSTSSAAHSARSRRAPRPEIAFDARPAVYAGKFQRITNAVGA